MSKHKILVIGGSGFIGSVLVKELLDRGYQVGIADKVVSEVYPDISVQCDVRDLEKLKAVCRGFDVIYNLAAEHKDNVTPRSLYTEVNVQGARNVCQAAAFNQIPFIIFTSSVAVYGFSKTETDEGAPCRPFNDYGRTKLEAEEVYKEWLREDAERTLVIIRPSVVFGTGNRGNVYNLLKQIASKMFVMVGNGKNRKSMVYVENIAGFLIFALGFGKGLHLYNYVDKPDFDMNTLVKLVKEGLGKGRKIGLRIPYFLGLLGGWGFDLFGFLLRRKFPISVIRVKKFCADTLFSSGKMQESGYQPPVKIEEGLRRMIRDEFHKA